MRECSCVSECLECACAIENSGVNKSACACVSVCVCA